MTAPSRPTMSASFADFVVYLGLLIRPRKASAAENLFLRRQLALYQERKVDPRRIDPATRITLALLSRLFNWRDALVVVQPKTLIRWHRAGFRLLWLCERLIGSLRRECLDWVIPLSEGHLRSLLKMWSTYYNRGRPHMALGPRVPDPPRGVPAPLPPHRHPLSASRAVVAKPVLNGLHHDYRLAPCST